MRVVPIKLFDDNYSYAVYTPTSSYLVLVDPADYASVKSAIAANPELASLEVTHVFSTHKHWDHSGNNEEIAKELPQVKIVGGSEDNIPACNTPLTDGQQLELENGLKVTALHTPCHTRGHMLYYFEDSSGNDIDKAVFTGDTIFVGGCGKFFEGDAEQMLAAMEKAKTLPPDTKLFCGHEYTEANFRWATQVDSENIPMKQKYEKVVEMRQQGKPTVPSSVQEEMETNIFMRAPLLTGLLGVGNPVEAMHALREMKNSGKTQVN